MEYSEYGHQDHGPKLQDSKGNIIMEHSYIPHGPPPPKVENVTETADIPGEMAHMLTLVALFIYGYTLIGCYIFEPCFFRTLAYVLQVIRLFLLFASLLPCVLHWQAFQLFPNITSKEFPFVVIVLFLGNILMAKGVQKLLGMFLEKFNSNEKDYDCCSSPCSSQVFRGWFPCKRLTWKLCPKTASPKCRRRRRRRPACS
nr:hypothetical protein BgiMline_011047 [Biomphalaria glabrata]